MLRDSKCGERNCKWYEGIKQPDDDELNEFHYCKAFPNGIPREVVIGENLHKEVMSGQQGDYVYEEA